MSFSFSIRARVVGLVLASLSLPLASVNAFAAGADYQFKLITTTPNGPLKDDLAIRLVHIPDGKAITDAVIFKVGTDMGPSGMETMTGGATLLPSDAAGLYHVQTTAGMAGNWEVVLSAKVQGEPETVTGKLTYAAAN